MRQVTVSGTVRRPIDDVYAFLVDSRNDGEWCPLADDVQLVEGEPGEGAVYRFRQGQGPGRPSATTTIRTVVARSPDHLVWEGLDERLPYRSEITLASDRRGGTRVTQTNRVTLPTPVRQLAWFTIAQVVLRVQLRRLARTLES